MSDYSRMRPRPRLALRAPRRLPPAEPAAPAPAPAVPVYRTQIIPFWLIGRVWQGLTWLVCLLSFGIGVAGNIGMFLLPDLGERGTLAVWIDRSSAQLGLAVAGALVYQIIIQVCQFYTAKVYGRRSLLYRFFLACSNLPSLWTYGLVIVVWAGSAWLWGNLWLIRVPIYIVSAFALLIVLVLNDMLQEWILVRD